MRIDMNQFGRFLISRPAGREAFLAARAYSLPKNTNAKIELDFSHVTVLTPSWIDEFMHGLEQEYKPDQIKVLPTNNSSVTLALKAIRN
ncbi:MAG: hypothetical protein A3E37_01470 [Candidatus Andersenbacteria bacterium RIFCSPHIGHO2_12_FULL_46_9]|nr:MAG: hypothetical protein UW94_C0020G0013 [Parcubacteria group bacterium GW2011_GWA2_45_14]OGY35805.1 MAG: hypothetical protein A3E37_01470 [Candidatus Andersenbacteria bacterium RIFCSPHIGHO2_12_FULL_46_9]OGY35947.1 MAG: hypothetical protein A3B76_04200 [Candidatus Andersenbacteria bacterium RIFCSPHIGHO2_02_FULL_46_16]OGY39006.1 MAG: hypothetical protein A3G57_03785 [Candidatus Andersenbacteria bacterium RIFCSPLOWO2_12_FULL_45_8]